jgi:hypothetical protein
MARISGRLIVDLLSDGKVRMVFLPTNGDKDAYPIKVTDLDEADLLFIACGLSEQGAAELRIEMCANRVAGVDTIIDDELAGKFRLAFPPTY